MKKILTTLLLSTILLTNGLAQQISATTYNKAIIHEDFSTEGDFFPIVTTSDNYFILDKGDYLLSRNNEDSEYAIMERKWNQLQNFVLKTAIRIGPSNNKKASVGVVIKAQKDGKGAIIFEINKKGEYRIKQLLANTYKTISGRRKDEGWVKNKSINGVNEHNFVEIRTENNLYDIYVNSDYLTTFFLSNYPSGSCGIIISAKTKARIAYYYIDTKGEDEQSTATYTNENIKNANTTIEELNKKIEILERNNTTLNNLNTDAKGNQEKKISNLTHKNADFASVTIEQEKEIASLQQNITSLKNNNEKIEELEKTISDNSILISKLNTDKNTLIDDVSTRTEESTRLNTKNTKLTSFTIEQKKEIANLQETITDLKRKNNEKPSASIKELFEKVMILKEKIMLEKSISTSLTNDLNKTKTSSKTRSTQLNTEINALKKTLSSLKKAKTTLTADLTKEKNVHKKTKNKLSKSETNKTTELNKLTAKLNNLKKQIESAKKTSAILKECTTNSANLSTKLKQANNELNAFIKTKDQHKKITTNLDAKITNLNSKVEALNNQISTANTELIALNTTNTELKNLFILKDFEMNGIKPSELTKQTNAHLPPAPKVLKGNKTVYAVQIGMFMQVQSLETFKKLDNVWYNSNDNGTYQYLSNEFSSPQEATAHKNSLIALGYPNAFVVTLTK